MKSLKAQLHPLSESSQELKVLTDQIPAEKNFEYHLRGMNLFPLKPTQLEIFQINLGKMCNQVCKHCHVDAGPDRKEIMDWETMELCLAIIESEKGLHTVDLTGGAPEMNPHFRRLVTEIRKIRPEIAILVRCNLTIILANPKFHDLPKFFKENRVEVISSLPYFTANRTDSQRGEGVFDKSIQALQLLNAEGYGMENSGLKLNLVYNPAGAFLPGSQSELEAEFKKKLRDRFQVEFNQLFTITNLPISRFLEYLLRSENFESYMEKLISAFNPAAALGVMCRNTLSIGWDGYLYDCDFTQMLDLKVESSCQHVSDWNNLALKDRSIVVNNHCFGCTAGAGSSCGGTTT